MNWRRTTINSRTFKILGQEIKTSLFEWRYHRPPGLASLTRRQNPWYCLCEKLINQLDDYYQSYEDFDSWWVQEGHCNQTPFPRWRTKRLQIVNLLVHFVSSVNSCKITNYFLEFWNRHWHLIACVNQMMIQFVNIRTL